jgi:hypothetical protein
MLRVSGVSLDPDSTREAHDVIIDGRGELSAFVMKLVRAREGTTIYGAVDVVEDALLSRRPIYEVVSALRLWCSDPEHEAEVACALLRVAQPDSRVEILNAGMPALTCVIPGGRLSMHPPLSGPIHGTKPVVHPYELSPLVWGSVWLVLSDALTGGATDPESVSARMIDKGVANASVSLARSSKDELRAWLPRIAGAELGADASLVVVHADPTRRFESGIR